MASIGEAAAHIDLSARSFHDILDAGVITRAGRRGYDLDAVRTAYIQHLREQAAGRTPTGGLASEKKAIHQIEPGETLFETLEVDARSHNALIYDTPKGRMKKRAKAEAQKAAGEGKKASIKLAGCRDGGGKLWSPNFLVFVCDDWIGIEQDMIIASVRFDQDSEGGTTRQLELKDPHALGGENPHGKSARGVGRASCADANVPGGSLRRARPRSSLALHYAFTAAAILTVAAAMVFG